MPNLKQNLYPTMLTKNDTNTDENKAMDKSSVEKTAKRTAKRRFDIDVILWTAFTAIALLSLAGSLYIASGLPNRRMPTSSEFGTRPPTAEPEPPTPPDCSAEINRYNGEVAAALGRHLARIGKLASDFEEGLQSKGPHRFDSARAAIPGIRNSFANPVTMTAVVKDGALDKAFGGERLQERFNVALEKPFMFPCARAGQSLIADYETFVARIVAEDAAFREELASAHGELPASVRVEFPVERLRADMSKTYGALHGMPFKAGLVAIETAIEAATIKATARHARNLALRFGGKAIAKGAATAVAPVADGALPFGDIVAVGGAIWTACDIHQLMRVLPTEIEKSLEGTINSLQMQTLNSVSDAARRTLFAHEQAARSLAESAFAETGRNEAAQAIQGATTAEHSKR